MVQIPAQQLVQPVLTLLGLIHALVIPVIPVMVRRVQIITNAHQLQQIPAPQLLLVPIQLGLTHVPVILAIPGMVKLALMLMSALLVAIITAPPVAQPVQILLDHSHVRVTPDTLVTV